MLITNKYTKVEKGEYKYVFYLNNRDYIENKRDFVKELNYLIERFSRELDDKGLIVKTYDSDIEKVRQEILDKPWPYLKRKDIQKTPGILMIDANFKEFNPNKNNWIYFYFIRDQRYKNNNINEFTIEEAEKLFDVLAQLIVNDNCNIFKEVKKYTRKETRRQLLENGKEELISYGITITADKLFNILATVIK